MEKKISIWVEPRKMGCISTETGVKRKKEKALQREKAQTERGKNKGTCDTLYVWISVGWAPMIGGCFNLCHFLKAERSFEVGISVCVL